MLLCFTDGFLLLDMKICAIILLFMYSTALSWGPFLKKTSKERAYVVMVTIVITFANQIFL